MLVSVPMWGGGQPFSFPLTRSVMMFEKGDRVVHPGYGAGIVDEIRSLKFLGNKRKRYYAIQLLTEPETTVMVAVRDEEKVGLRPPIPRARLSRVWKTLRANPHKLPKNYKKRQAELEEKLDDASAVEVAEVMRDLAWRRERRNRFTISGRRLYKRSMALLAGEVASTQGTDVLDAKLRIENVLDSSLSESEASA
jgi:RNA polymerase-interacting CarD/CdnL/TRCF family regulator